MTKEQRNRFLEFLFFCFMMIFIGCGLGYCLRIQHEKYNNNYYKSQAEKNMDNLEKEFHDALKKPHEFYIFNHKYKIYPLKAKEPTFSYAGAGDSGKRKVYER